MSYDKILEKKYKGKKVLITGGTGFLGKNFVPLLESYGAKVIAVGSEIDLTRPFFAESLFNSNIKFDYIFHGAAVQGAGEYPLKYPAEQFYKNNLIHVYTFENWKKYQPQAIMVGLGTTCFFPSKHILKEEDYFSGPLHPSVETYGLTKCNMLQGIKAYKQQYGLKGTVAVLTTLYGPHDSFDLEKVHVVSALVKKFCDGKLDNSKQVEVWGDGLQSRELIYVEDQIKGILLVADYDGDLINVGSGQETTIKFLAEKIKETVGYQGEIFYNTDRFVGARQKVLDISKAKEKYSWSPQVTLEQGLKKTIEWYMQNEQ